MTTVRKNLLTAALLLVLFCAALFAADGADERLCTVRGSVGTAQVRISPNSQKVRREMAVARPVGAPAVSAGITGEWTDLRLNMVLGERCEIRTGPQSEVRLETSWGGMIRVGENTVFEIAALEVERKTVRGKAEATVSARFKVQAGSIVANIKNMMYEKTNVRFETPTATAAIRGTTVEVEAAKTGTVIRAFDGTVEVAPAGAKRFVPLVHGKMTEVGRGQKAVVVRDVPKDYKRKGVWIRGETPPVEGASGAAGMGAVVADKGVKAVDTDAVVADKDAKAVDTDAVVADKDAKAVDTDAVVADKDVKAVDTDAVVVDKGVKAVAADKDVKTVVPAAAVGGVDSVMIELGLSLGGVADTIQCYVGSTITVEGVVSPPGAVVSVGGAAVKPGPDGVFRRTWTAPLEPGVITLTISAESGNQVKAIVRTIRVAPRPN